MDEHFTSMYIKLITSVLIWIILVTQISAQTGDFSVIVHLRGIYKSKVSLLGRPDSKVFKSISEVQDVPGGETARISVSKDFLPGEFVLRFDYKEKESSTPYPSEKYLFINDQDLELWISPIYCNNVDSTWFQKGERENTAFALFSKENGKRKEKLGLIQNFLMNYDDTKSEFYQQGIKEYEQRRQVYNQWLSDCIQKKIKRFLSVFFTGLSMCRKYPGKVTRLIG